MTELNETAPPSSGRFDRKNGRSRAQSRDNVLASPLVMRGALLPQLSRAIEAEIIPRLAMAHARKGVTPVPVRISAEDREAVDFADLVLGPQNAQATEFIQDYRDRGFELETIYLDLLVPTAKHLRHMWMDDERDFAEITLGLWRLQQLLREFSPAFCAGVSVRSAGLRVLLAPAPGEAQDLGFMMFGLVLASEFFRRDGWDTWIEPDSGNSSFNDALRTQWFNVVEYFASTDRKLDDLASNIRMVRRESSNQDIGVMVCGQAFTERPELVLLVGGDAVVSDLTQEASQARNVVSMMTERR